MSDLDPRTIRSLIRAMPKAELHLHLDGSMRIETALDLARTRDIEAPASYAGMRRILVPADQVHDQAELLLAFDLPIALLQDTEAIGRATAELAEDKAFDRVRYVEIRWAPLLHTDRGLTGRQVVETVARAARETAARLGIEVRLIATLMRIHPPEDNLAFMRDLEAGGIPGGLVAVDLAGPEARAPDPEAHRPAFEAARAIGLHVTLHAGEWGGAAQVRRALALDPERIAHGPLAIDDPDLVEELKARRTWLDLCPTSNVQARIVPSVADHPLRRLLRAGVPVTLSTDDMTVSDVSLSDEYERAVTVIGVTLPELWAMNVGAVDAAFCDVATKDRLRAAMTAWGAGIPELATG